MKNGKARWLAEAQSYVAECRRGASSVRASEFAMRMRRTPAQLAREFHAIVGFCVKDYFKALQIEQAKELLRTTVRSTAQIAADAGFGTARSFYRVFRRRTGVSPTQYRREKNVTGTD